MDFLVKKKNNIASCVDTIEFFFVSRCKLGIIDIVSGLPEVQGSSFLF